MSENDIYRELAEKLKAPVSRRFLNILEEMFTPEEAELACQMPMNPIPAAGLAAETGRDPGEVERLLEGMADKGLVFTYEPGGVRHYNLMQMLPGIFEMQFFTQRN